MIYYENIITNESALKLPQVWSYNGNVVMGLTEANMSTFGWNKVETIDPEPEVIEPEAVIPTPDIESEVPGTAPVTPPSPLPPSTPIFTEALHEKEKAFTAKLIEYATTFNVNLMTLPSINIGSVLQAAKIAGASDTDIANASAILLALAKDVEAESDQTWTRTWLGLKARLPGYLVELYG